MFRTRTLITYGRRRVRYLSFWNHKRKSYTVIRMVPSMYGHTSDPTFPEEHGFATRQAAENRCRALRKGGHDR